MVPLYNTLSTLFRRIQCLIGRRWFAPDLTLEVSRRGAVSVVDGPVSTTPLDGFHHSDFASTRTWSCSLMPIWAKAMERVLHISARRVRRRLYIRTLHQVSSLAESRSVADNTFHPHIAETSLHQIYRASRENVDRIHTRGGQEGP